MVEGGGGVAVWCVLVSWRVVVGCVTARRIATYDHGLFSVVSMDCVAYDLSSFRGLYGLYTESGVSLTTPAF